MGTPRYDRDRDEASGALGDFILGAALAGWGATMVCQRVMVSTVYRISWFGHEQSSFAPVFALFLLGVFLYGLGRTFLAKIFMITGAAMTAWGVMANLEVSFAPAPVLQTFIMFSLLVGGVGLLLRSMIASRD